MKEVFNFGETLILRNSLFMFTELAGAKGSIFETTAPESNSAWLSLLRKQLADHT